MGLHDYTWRHLSDIPILKICSSTQIYDKERWLALKSVLCPLWTSTSLWHLNLKATQDLNNSQMKSLSSSYKDEVIILSLRWWWGKEKCKCSTFQWLTDSTGREVIMKPSTIHSPWLYRPSSSCLHGLVHIEHLAGKYKTPNNPTYLVFCNCPFELIFFLLRRTKTVMPLKIDAILKAKGFCLKQKFLLPWQPHFNTLFQISWKLYLLPPPIYLLPHGNNTVNKAHAH